MQDRQLNEKESLELIANMIRNTKRKMKEGSGTMFLIWGYMTIFVTLLVWGTVLYTKSYYWQWLWLLLPVGAGIISILYNRKRKKTPFVTTYVDKVIGYIWAVIGITGFLLSMVSVIYYFPILFIIVLMMGIGTTLTGLVIEFRPLAISGILGMALSIVLLLLDYMNLRILSFPAFAAIFFLMMVIPGHYLNYKARSKDV
ncbi:MAG: hypothetical protein LUH10_13830 [Tannerellaceae bacterium]|nr:hypothetical protein [Tannerellaceae bacterium]